MLYTMDTSSTLQVVDISSPLMVARGSLTLPASGRTRREAPHPSLRRNDMAETLVVQSKIREMIKAHDCATSEEAITAIVEPKRRECSECVKIGSWWMHLRTCQTCGVTLCCDSSPNRHAHKHADASSHPVVASAEPGERWLYCYPDDSTAGY